MVKSEATRARILESALAIFRERGFREVHHARDRHGCRSSRGRRLLLL